MSFELELTRICSVLGPIAKAIKCLESSHSTPGDVYLFWLAITAHLEQLFTDASSILSAQTKESIRAIINKRFNQMINHAPTDIYITTFFLDPSEHLSVFR